jgi:hypothetical protein
LTPPSLLTSALTPPFSAVRQARQLWSPWGVPVAPGGTPQAVSRRRTPGRQPSPVAAWAKTLRGSTDARAVRGWERPGGSVGGHWGTASRLLGHARAGAVWGWRAGGTVLRRGRSPQRTSPGAPRRAPRACGGLQPTRRGLGVCRAGPSRRWPRGAGGQGVGTVESGGLGLNRPGPTLPTPPPRWADGHRAARPWCGGGGRVHALPETRQAVAAAGCGRGPCASVAARRRRLRPLSASLCSAPCSSI